MLRYRSCAVRGNHSITALFLFAAGNQLKPNIRKRYDNFDIITMHRPQNIDGSLYGSRVSVTPHMCNKNFRYE